MMHLAAEITAERANHNDTTPHPCSHVRLWDFNLTYLDILVGLSAKIVRQAMLIARPSTKTFLVSDQ